MKDYRKCPVCNKSDIPNYMNEDVKCPCCGADLSVYRKIELAKASARKPKKIVWLVGVPCCIIIVLMFMGIISYTKKLESKESELSLLTENNELLTAERDSLSRLVELYQSNVDVENDMKIYIVKKGDSFCQISKRLYGTESRFIEIVEYNNLTLSTIIHPGDTLKIKGWD